MFLKLKIYNIFIFNLQKVKKEVKTEVKKEIKKEVKVISRYK